ncbi:putative zygote-specific protein [Botrytis cinerea BcDW1]|uniref:Putative zygote-specific protein n=1 Tax=Botryotinia fuckeliana (strain BcDW1) TaxID=1290391 RepID=M7TVV5_BOTF1|nr:putative zygote-specific protein [Botrytis cinerea BcDW1]
MKPTSPSILLVAGLAGIATAGPIAYGICQSGCAAVVMACYSAGGATWGATLGATAPATIVACNTAFGTCSATCAGFLVAPIP